MTYALSTRVGTPYDETVQAVREALGEQGFGVLTEIDVQATLKKKLDVDVPAQVILGACRPPLAHAALQAEPSIGLLLPCNVVVYERDANSSTVAAMAPLPAIFSAPALLRDGPRWSLVLPRRFAHGRSSRCGFASRCAPKFWMCRTPEARTRR